MAIRAIEQSAESPQFANAADCREWLAALPLTNVTLVQQTLTKQLHLLRQSCMIPDEQLGVLAALWEPVLFVQTALAQKYAGKPLPLDTDESAVWSSVQKLWLEYADACIGCRDAYARNNINVEQSNALILVHAIRCMAAAMLEHYRIYLEVTPALWEKLNQLYASAERAGFARISVKVETREEVATTDCLAAYCTALLAHLAHPFSLSARQMNLLSAWIPQWAAVTNLAAEPLPPSGIPALGIDLAGDRGPGFAESLQPSPTLRHLDLDAIGRNLRQLMGRLKQGQTPAQLGLGKEARQQDCESLLMLLYIQWCRAGTARGEQRMATAEHAQVCLGLHAAHFHISGRAFRPPGAGLSRQEEDDMRLFGHISERTERQLSSAQSQAVESWKMMNQSDSGFMCMVRDTDTKLRIGHQQLVAVRRGASKLFHLGLIQWMRAEDQESLFAGVRLFPGVARAVAVRPTNFNAPGDIRGQFERGLLLPELPTSTAPMTLVLPSGWYQPGRIVELHSEQKVIAKLTGLLEKGSDFERCTVSLS